MNSTNEIIDNFKHTLISVIQVIVIFGMVTMLGIFLIHIAFDIIVYGERIVKNVNKYEKILNEEIYDNKDILKYFPEKVPEFAENVEFYYKSPFLEDSFEIKLEFDATSEEIDRYIDKYKNDRSRTKIIEPNGDSNRLCDYGTKSYGFDLNENRTDLTIYILWNSEERIAFIAVNEEKTEILFQAERW